MDEMFGRVSRQEILSRCTGMSAERAVALLALLPELGRVSTSYAVRLAGLSAAQDAKELDVAKKKALQIQRLLGECARAALQDKESGLAGFLRHLAETHGAARTRVCLAATLRWYSDALRRPGVGMSGAEPYPVADDAELLAAEDDSDL